MKLNHTLYIFLLSTAMGFSQGNFILYNSDFIPQSNYVNPGTMPQSKINIGLPVISSIYSSFGNNGFNLNDVFTSSGSLNMTNLIANLKPSNYLTYNLQVDLLSFGIRVKDVNYFSFNLTEKGDVWFKYPKDLMSLLWNGNGAYLGQTMNIDFGLNATHYREWGFGWTHEQNEKLTYGGRFKLLNGLENFSGKASGTLTTSASDFSITGSSNVKLNSSIDTGNYSHFNPTSYLLDFQNFGMGADLGASYKYNDQFTFSASILDLGFINWKTNPSNYVSQNPGGTATYSGVSLNGLLSNSQQLSNSFTKMGDSLQKTFNINTTHTKYTTFIPAKIYLSGNYKLNPVNSVGLLLFGEVIDATLHPGLTVSLSSHIGTSMSSMLTYSMYNSAYNIVGFGFSLNMGPVQVYALADNILALLVYNQYVTTTGNSYDLPANTKYFNVRLGINVVIGKKKGAIHAMTSPNSIPSANPTPGPSSNPAPAPDPAPVPPAAPTPH